MAKRELIDREKAENTTWEGPSYTDALNVLMEVRDKIRELPVITEQDIVKPVLDKIRAEIFKVESDCRLSIDEYPSCKQCTDNVFGTIYRILDKYKAESEET